MPSSSPSIDVGRVVQALDCFTEAELCAVANVTDATLTTWRHRGTGPGYVRFGNTYLYPREAVAKYLRGKLREAEPMPVGGML